MKAIPEGEPDDDRKYKRFSVSANEESTPWDAVTGDGVPTILEHWEGINHRPIAGPQRRCVEITATRTDAHRWQVVARFEDFGE